MLSKVSMGSRQDLRATLETVAVVSNYLVKMLVMDS